MESINPIRFGITGSSYAKPDLTEDTGKKETRTKKEAAEKKEMSSNDVLNYLAAQNTEFIPKTTTRSVDVTRYVNKEQQERIEDMMKGFEANFEEAYTIAANEFPELSENAASELALAWAESN